MKILHLEDSLPDAELAHSLLRTEGVECDVKVVATRKDFLASLTVHNYDLILSDFNLINFNGLEALHLAREQAPDIPFVFLSGTIGEDRAIEALRAGAADYVIKDRPKRLVPAIRRAVSDAQLVREKQAAAEQLLRLQRLENIGMLAAGIAHDINNVLAPVLMGTALLKTRHRAEVDLKILGSMENSAIRGAGLVKQILGFAHGVAGAPSVLQPRHLIRDLIGIMGQTFPKHIQIRDETEAALWPIMANLTQFHQVLLNLCVNARDAMPKGGALTLRAANLKVEAASPDGEEPGSYLVLEVQDTGTGIPPEIQSKIWDPFFTTKGEGQGTGLGLGMVRGIVNQHGGSISFQTKLGQGTTFRVVWPAAPESETATGTAAPVAIPRGHGELILVVDDDASVRELTGASLTEHGYRVVTANDGTEAVARFALRSLEYRVMITDIDMPNLDGAALAKVVGELNPMVKIVLTSGSAEANDPRRQPPAGGRFIAKPYAPEVLLQTVHELVRRDSNAPWPSAS